MLHISRRLLTRNGLINRKTEKLPTNHTKYSKNLHPLFVLLRVFRGRLPKPIYELASNISHHHLIQ